MQVTLPFQPRPYQLPFLKAMNADKKRACLVWHRRAGKEMACFNWMVYAALKRVGIYYYFFPSLKQGKRVLWYGMDRDGHRWIDYYLPKALVTNRNETDLRLELKNGSVIQVLGLDSYKKDDIVGTGLMGGVFSEFSLQDPEGWKYMRPILTESGGWAVFNFTPRGHNHAKELYDLACQSMATDGDWFVSKLTIEDTKAISLADVDKDRRDGMTEEEIQQEYYCSFNAGLVGAYFARYIEQARAQGRIGKFPAIPGMPVHTAWDIGVNDPTAIWFFQKINDQPRLIKYYEMADKGGLPAHAKYLQELGYQYGYHLAPHDISVTEWGQGVSRYQTALELGIQFDRQERTDKNEQIYGAQRLLAQCLIDESGCAQGIKVLEAYEEDYDKALRVFKSKPKHNWAAHGADALQTLALGFNLVTNDLFNESTPRIRVVDSFDPWGYGNGGYRTVSQGLSWDS